jgi:hypothetical protein
MKTLPTSSSVPLNHLLDPHPVHQKERQLPMSHCHLLRHQQHHQEG